MAAELLQSDSGWERVRDALGEIRACHAEVETYFQEVTGEFDRWGEVLVQHQRQWERQSASRQEMLEPMPPGNEERFAVWQKEIERQCGEIRNSRELQQQCVELQQERSLLESELESVRGRAAELTELLNEQKHGAAERQARWDEELRHMRMLLETIAGRQSEAERQMVQRLAASPGPAPAADPVLGSVLAQFELIQQDCARRRQA